MTKRIHIHLHVNDDWSESGHKRARNGQFSTGLGPAKKAEDPPAKKDGEEGEHEEQSRKNQKEIRKGSS